MVAHGLEQSSQAMREFYAAAPDAPIESLADQLATVKQNAVVHGIGRLAGRHAITAELAHAGIVIGADDIPFELDQGEGQEIISGVRKDAAIIAQAALLTGAEMQTSLDRHVLYQHKRPVAHRVMAGMVLAAVAYEGMVRKSGRPYYEHPNEIVSILRAAWRHWNPPDELLINQNVLEAASFVAYLHDAFEDAFSKSEQTYLAQDVVISPLVAKVALTYLGHGDQAAELANGLLLLTHPIGVEDGKMHKSPYEDYVHRGLMADIGSHWFAIIKMADVQHNRIIEPKIPGGPHGIKDRYSPVPEHEVAKVFQKRVQYGAAQDDILDYVRRHYDSELLRYVITHIQQVRSDDVREEKRKQPIINIHLAATTFREHLEILRAA